MNITSLGSGYVRTVRETTTPKPKPPPLSAKKRSAFC